MSIGRQSISHPRLAVAAWIVFVGACFCVVLATQPTITERTIAAATVTFAIALLIMATSFRRTRLGVSAPRGESMFVDLRDRISKQGDLPALPPQWLVESVAKAARVLQAFTPLVTSLSLRQLADRTGIPRSTAHAISPDRDARAIRANR